MVLKLRSGDHKSSNYSIVYKYSKIATVSLLIDMKLQMSWTIPNSNCPRHQLSVNRLPENILANPFLITVFANSKKLPYSSPQAFFPYFYDIYADWHILAKFQSDISPILAGDVSNLCIQSEYWAMVPAKCGATAHQPIPTWSQLLHKSMNSSDI